MAPQLNRAEQGSMRISMRIAMRLGQTTVHGNGNPTHAHGHERERVTDVAADGTYRVEYRVKRCEHGARCKPATRARAGGYSPTQWLGRPRRPAVERSPRIFHFRRMLRLSWSKCSSPSEMP